MSEPELIESLKGKFGAEASKDKWGVLWCSVPREKLKDVLSFLKEQGYTHFSTITGVDRPKEGVIELIYHLLNENESNRLPYICVKTNVPRDSPTIPSITDIYPAADLYEREVYDLLGVKFEGHPQLKRLLLPEEVPEGIHPLRKDWKGGVYSKVKDVLLKGE